MSEPHRDDAAAVLLAQTDWEPLKPGGSNFRMKRLVEAGPDRLEFRGAAGAYVFFGTFLTIGSGFWLGMTQFGDPGFWLRIFVGLFSGVFMAVGAFGLRHIHQPIVFDRRDERWWKGRARLDATGDDQGPLRDIRALQIVAEHISSDSGGYRSYELNLVLEDGTRRNIVDQGTLGVLRDEARRLAAFLDRPLWDAASQPGALRVHEPPAG